VWRVGFAAISGSLTLSAAGSYHVTGTFRDAFGRDHAIQETPVHVDDAQHTAVLMAVL
jgi:hypothetical protein